MTNWRDDRLGVQIEHALADVTLTPGCDFGVLIRQGNVKLIGQMVWNRDFEAVLDVLLEIPGVEEVTVAVVIAGCEPIGDGLGRKRSGRQWDIRFGSD